MVEISLSHVKSNNVQLTFEEKELEKKKGDKGSNKKEKVIDSDEPITMFQEVFRHQNKGKEKNVGT